MYTGEESYFHCLAVFFSVITKVRGQLMMESVRACDRERLAIKYRN